jgi:hypothetical protein
VQQPTMDLEKRRQEEKERKKEKKEKGKIFIKEALRTPRTMSMISPSAKLAPPWARSVTMTNSRPFVTFSLM